MSFIIRLTELLKTDPRFTDEVGDLLVSAVRDCAWRIDHALVRLLLSDEAVKDKFFDEIDGYWVFNTNTFIEYISQKDFLDNSYTRFRNKIGLTIGDEYISERGEVALAFPYKDCVLEGGQTKEEEKRKELFFNEVLAEDEINQLFSPKVLTNFKRYTVEGEQTVTDFKRDENGVIRENLIIKGNNLLALHILKEQFRGQIKLIYIDPPFNTSGAANTFSYNNNFNHSSWLTFMKNRVEIAYELLTSDGLLIIAIDHSELFYLGLLVDEIFKRENRIGIVAVETNPRGRSDSKFLATSSEYFLLYAKDEKLASINPLPLSKDQEKVFKYEDKISKYRLLPFQRSGSNSTPLERPNLFYPIFYDKHSGYIGLDELQGSVSIEPIDAKGNKRVWRQGKESFLNNVKRGDIIIKERRDSFHVFLKDRIKEGRKPKTIWVNPSYDASSHGTMLLQEYFGENVFSYPKSINLVIDILRIATNKNDIILDFFAGSGTTAHATLELNNEDKGDRKFILCEQMSYVNNVTVKRVKKVIDELYYSDFVYFELEKYNKVFIYKIQNCQHFEGLIEIWRDITESSFLKWYVNPEAPEDAIQDFIAIGEEDNGLEKQKKLLIELLDKNQLYVNLSEIDDAQFNVSEEDKALNRAFYGEV
jgi:adenine-specific DNA-methyltransferase